MLIDFSDIEEKPLEHFKGGEGTFFARMFTDPKVKIMRGRLEHGASIGLHTHEGNSEIVFILEGKGFPQEAAPTARRVTSTALSTTARAT